MGISLYTRYNPKATAPTGAYPDGSAKNNTIPTGTDGTPYEKDILNDLYGFLARLTGEAGITISNAPDDFNSSDYYDSFITLFSMKYDTVADMIAADLQVGSFVTTKGYLAAGDLGGSNYQIVAPATGTDDGGKFIDLTNSNQAKLIPNGAVTSKQYGAVGNGATDDTIPIQNLIDAFTNIQINTVSLVTGLTLRSEMKIEILETLSIANGNLLSATTKNNIDIIFRKDGVLLGDNSLSDIGILIDGCTDVNVYSPLIFQFVESGISITNGSTACKIVDGIIQSCGVGIILEDTTTLYNNISRIRLNTNTFGLKVLGASYNNIENVSCVGNDSAGIFLQDKTGGCTNNIFKGCICNDGTGTGTADGGVVVQPLVASVVPHDNIFIGQICNNNASYGILMYPATAVIDSGEVSGYNFKFVSPVCNENKDGIYLARANNIQINDASCSNNDIHGLFTEVCDSIRVAGGSYNNNITDGINHKSIKTVNDGVSMEGNGRYGIAISDTTDIGALLTPTYHNIVNCMIQSNVTLPISISGGISLLGTKAINCYGMPQFGGGGLVTNWRDSILAQDGDVIDHRLIIPTGYTVNNMIIIATASVQGHTVTVRDKTSTTFTIDLVDASGTPVAIDEDINWEAHLY